MSVMGRVMGEEFPQMLSVATKGVPPWPALHQTHFPGALGK